MNHCSTCRYWQALDTYNAKPTIGRCQHPEIRTLEKSVELIKIPSLTAGVHIEVKTEVTSRNQGRNCEGWVSKDGVQQT